jgi:hypothetical protein
MAFETEPDRRAAPRDFADEVARRAGAYDRATDAALLADVEQTEGTVSWGGMMLQVALDECGVDEMPPQVARALAGHWDLLVWRAAVRAAVVRRVLTSRGHAYSATGGDDLAQRLDGLAAAIWIVATGPYVGDAAGPRADLLPWFCSIPADERARIRSAYARAFSLPDEEPTAEEVDQLCGVRWRLQHD